MTNISFDNPYLLLIAIPLLALILVPFFIAFRKQNRDKHVITSLILHLLMIVCVTLASAGLSATRIVTETNVYVVADVSYSSHLNFDEVDGYISKVRGKLPKNSKMGVVCFGKDAVVHNALGKKITSVSEATVDDSATDIYGALNYTASLFKPNVIKHIVLITDANQTDGANESDLRETIATLQQKDIHVNAIFVDATLPQDVAEIQVNSVEYVQSTYSGQGTEAVAYIQSNTTTTASVKLYKGEELVFEEAVDLIAGENEYAFTLDTTQETTNSVEEGVENGAEESGNSYTVSYTLTVEDEEDGLLLNNEYSFTQEITNKRKILLIGSSLTNDEKWEMDNAEQFFAGDDIELEVCRHLDDRKKLKVPTTIEELCGYDQIVISSINFPEQVEGYTQFIDNLNVAVSTYGKSLLTFGDLQLQAKTDGANDLENLENILPVQFGAPDDATLYGIVIDVSRSMNENGEMQKAKDAASFLIEQFNPSDGIILVSYAASGEVVMTMRNATEAGKAEAKAVLMGLKPIQGTYVAGGLERMQLEMSSHPNFSKKEVILIGDSEQASTTVGGTSATNVAKNMYAEGIRVSALNIGEESDQGQFKKITQSGKGKYYVGCSDAQLKSVLEGGDIVENITGTIVNNVTTAIRIQSPTDAVLDGINSFNPIKGYICGQAKGDAVVVLAVDHVRADGSTTKLPLYSYRSCGKGKVATFNSKLGGSWVDSKMPSAVTFIDKKGDQAGMTFFRNVLETNVPTERIDLPCLYTVTPSANTTIEVVPSNLYQTTSVEITLTTPSGKIETQALNFDGARHFATLETSELGKYDLEIKYVFDGKEYSTKTTFTIPYWEEYNRFAGYSAGLLYELVDGSGIVSWDGNDINFNINKDDIETYVYSFVVPLMITCVVLFIVDVCIRKLRWNDIKSIFVRQSKAQKKGGKR